MTIIILRISVLTHPDYAALVDPLSVPERGWNLKKHYLSFLPQPTFPARRGERVIQLSADRVSYFCAMQRG